jgi:pimeloyl-ACP methyl ester carboxylesterase
MNAETTPPEPARPEPSFREAGRGPTVVCLHANAGNAGQWRGLMDRLSGSFRVLAPDAWGAGKSPAWPHARPYTLDDELALLEPVLAHAGDRFDLVGHSYGAATALVAAVRHQRRVRSLVLYEPTLFALLDEQRPPPNGADGIRQVCALATAALAQGDRRSAARHFIDFWMGAGALEAMPAHRQEAIEAAMVDVHSWATALFGHATPLSAFAALDLPVLLMVGRESPASSRDVAQLLAATLPRVQVVELAGLGHMGPVTHAEVVNDRIDAFLRG